MTIQVANTDEEILACYGVMAQLRPHVSAKDFLSRVRLQQRQGYVLAFVEAEGVPVTVAGYRILEQLFGGRVLYVDDLVTDESWRSSGYGTRLLRWLVDQAREEGCASLELDSGIQRLEAHRFYEREGMLLSSYHFRLPTL